MPKIESEKIDCLHRPCSRPAPRGIIESVRTHAEVSEQFDSFSLLKLLFLGRNSHCWSWKAFPRQMTPQNREKTAKTAVFQHRWQAWKVVRSIAAVRQRPRTPRSAFPTKHSLRIRTQVRHECTQVADEKRSSKLAKSISVPFGADRPHICHSKRYTRAKSGVLSHRKPCACMHVIAIEAWASGQL